DLNIYDGIILRECTRSSFDYTKKFTIMACITIVISVIYFILADKYGGYKIHVSIIFTTAFVMITLELTLYFTFFNVDSESLVKNLRIVSRAYAGRVWGEGITTLLKIYSVNKISEKLKEKRNFESIKAVDPK
ncbi:MAG: hypothetical protein MHPSP_004477, partial [Paramarteilia canceri]